MAERDCRFEIRPGEFREVASERLSIPSNFIDGARFAKARYVEWELAFQLCVNLKGVAVLDSSRRPRQRSHLPELRLAGASQRAEDLASGLCLLLEHDLESACLKNLE